MRSLRAWLARFGGLFGRRRRDHELADEMESHLQMHIEDNLQRGMAPAEARRQALIKLGGVEQTKESYRERRGIPFLETLLQDIRFGFRMLRKNPGFTIVAVLTLALAIGANATTFILADAVLLKNLPIADSDRVLYIASANRETGSGRGESFPDYVYLQSRARSFQSLAAFSDDDVDVSDKDATPTQIRGGLMTFNAFSVIGQRPIIGRDFLPEDARPGAPPEIGRASCRARV